MENAINVLDFEPEVAIALPATYALLRSANLTLHPSVAQVILHGSRGLAGSYRPDSDIDLSLIVDLPPLLAASDLEQRLHAVFETTWQHWQASVEPDLAIIFETQHCGLRCFEQRGWREGLCATGGTDCFGLYKVQKGFTGLVTNAGVQVKRMYPCLKIWQRA